MARSVLMRSTEWESALCTQADPEAWFPGLSPAKSAKKVCEGCSVRRLCLEVAIVDNEPCGVWGGMVERARRAVRSRLRKVVGPGVKFTVGMPELAVLLDEVLAPAGVAKTAPVVAVAPEAEPTGPVAEATAEETAAAA
jgi:WhiB family redox-sensing transcriptional regulator